MPLRPPAGFISAFYDPLKVADAPTIGTATSGDASATVPFTAPTNTGGAAITQYYAVSNPGQITGNAASSPVTVSGLTNGTSYTFTVWALNSYGPSPYSAASNSVTPENPPRGLFGGGLTSSAVNIIDYITISSVGNATDFGDLTVSRRNLGAASSSTRGLFCGGLDVNVLATNVIDYVTIASTGNATDFGDNLQTTYYQSGCSSSTRGLFGGGNVSGETNIINYVTIASTGNATDFGDLTVARQGCASFSSSTRGIFSGGSNTNIIDYVTISSVGNATDFGDLLSPDSASGSAGCSSGTRGVMSLGSNGNGLQYITIASTGNAVSFGNLSTSARGNIASASSTVRGVWAGGYSGGNSNVMDYVTIASTGNATDFGDLTAAREALAGCSSAHGGLQ